MKADRSLFISAVATTDREPGPDGEDGDGIF